MKDLGEWREEIDRLDRQVVSLLNRRARCVLRLAPLKRRHGVPVREPNRETAVLANVAEANDGPLSVEAVQRIYESVIHEMRSVQRDRDS